MQANITAHLLKKKKKKLNQLLVCRSLSNRDILCTLQLLFLVFSSSCAITAKKQVSV